MTTYAPGGLFRRLKGEIANRGEFVRDLGRQTVGFADEVATVGSGLLRSIPAGVNGLLRLGATLDPDAAAARVEEVMADPNLTYVPRTQEARENFASVGDLMQRAGTAINSTRSGRAATNLLYDASAAQPLASALLAGSMDLLGPSKGKGAVMRAADDAAIRQSRSLLAKPATRAPTVLNVGLKVGEDGSLTAKEVKAALKDRGIDVVDHEVLQSGTEPTFVARLSRPLTKEEGNDLSVALKQEAIAQRSGDVGEMFGPQAEKWGPFNSEYFLEPGAATKVDPVDHMSLLPKGVQSKIEKAPELRGTYERIVPYLTPDEIGRLRQNGVESLQSLMNDLDAGKIASPEDLATMASLGQVKRGWYQNSAEALADVFGDDSPRFVALLSSLSPQTGVEANLTNALKMWRNWTTAGRPTGRADIMRIMGESVQGSGTENSVLKAWKNNTFASLTHPDPRALQLSGPKVNSFAGNLRGLVNEVTNDTWQAEAVGVTQKLFDGANLKGLDAPGVGGKSIGYMFTNALTREAASLITAKTGVKWTASEVQEAVWSWVKTVVEKRRSEGVLGDDMISIANSVTDKEIAGTPDFASLLPTGAYGEILTKAGYGPKLGLLATKSKAAIPAGRPFGKRRLGAIAERLERQHQAGKNKEIRRPAGLFGKQSGFASSKLLAGLGAGGLLGAYLFSGRKAADDAKEKNQKLNSRTERALREMEE